MLEITVCDFQSSGEVDAIDLEIAEEWFCDQSEALCSTGQSSNHRKGRDEDVHPAVVKRECDRRLAYFSGHKKAQKRSQRVATSLSG